MANFSLTPSLFIGIGSNGWRILDDLRKLMFEEFGQAGLPCFRYIGIETNAERKVDDSFLPHNPHDYEKVEPIHITIPNINVVEQHIDPRLDQTYLPGLHDWLDDRLLKKGYQSFMAGAGGSRQAGRLCLWENWEPVKKTINDAFDQIKTVANRNATQTLLLTSYFPQRHIEPPSDLANLISATPKVYIVGTLCGGTCSGTFLDIAYFVSKLVGGQRAGVMRRQGGTEVVGMFTISDTRSVAATIPSAAINCWAALRELDFYFRNESTYKAELPDKTRLHTRDQPFDWVYLVSMQNMAGVGFTGEPEGPLTQMCAMNLFTEVVAGMAATKDEKRIDLRTSCPGYLTPNQAGHIRAFSSFGLSAIWYPRYRITRGINRRLGKELCSAWLKPHFSSNTVRDQCVKQWAQIISHAEGSLIGTVGGAPNNEGLNQEKNLKQVIEKLLASGEQQLQAVDEFGLGDLMFNFPNSEQTFVDRLNKPDGDKPNGEYYSRIASLQNLVIREFKLKIRTTVANFLRDHTFAETEAYLEHLEQLATRTAEAIPNDLPSFSQKMDLPLAPDVHHDPWTKLLFMQNQAVTEFKQTVWGDFKSRVMNQLENVRDHFMKGVLQAAQPHFANLKNELANAKIRLTEVQGNCELELAKELECKSESNIVLISDANPASIASAVEAGVQEILASTDRVALRTLFLSRHQAGTGSTDLSENPLDLIQSNTPQVLVLRTDKMFDRLSQPITSRFSITGEALEQLNNPLLGLVESSAPFVQASILPPTLPRTPNLLFCADSTAGAEMEKKSNAHLRPGITFQRVESPLDHFIFFYQEFPGLAISDLAINELSSRLLENAEKVPINTEEAERFVTRFTHKMGAKMFDVKAIREYELATSWIAAMRLLAPQTFTTIKGEECLIYETETRIKLPLCINNVEEIRGYVASNGTVHLVQQFCKTLNEIGEAEILARVNAKVEQANTVPEKIAIGKTFNPVLEIAFKRPVVN